MQLDYSRPEWIPFQRDVTRQEEREFNRKRYLGWFGYAKIHDLRAWVDNPRIGILVDKWKKTHPGDPNNYELLDIMLEYSESANQPQDPNDDDSGRKSTKNDLLELAENIQLNGIRHALIVTHEKK